MLYKRGGKKIKNKKIYIYTPTEKKPKRAKVAMKRSSEASE